jgi:carboxyl-terminal processing protease
LIVAQGAILVSALIGACSAAPKGAPQPTTAGPAAVRPPTLAIETFDEVWRSVAAEEFAPLREGVDWTAIGNEFRPRVAAARSDAEVRVILESMLGRLKQSHFGIIPGDVAASEEHAKHGANDPSTIEMGSEGDGSEDDGSEAGSGDLGVWFRLIEEDGRPRIVTVAPRSGGPADRAGIRAGWELLAVNGRTVSVPSASLPTDHGSSATSATGDSTQPRPEPRMQPGDAMRRFNAQRRAANSVRAEPGETVVLTLRDDLGTEHRASVTAQSFGGEIAEFGDLPPMEVLVTTRLIEPAELKAAGAEAEATNLRIGVIAFNIWMLPIAAEIDAAVDRFRDCDAIIMDLRGNPGGIGGLAMGVGGHFLDTPESLGTMSNLGGTMDFRVNPRRVSVDAKRVQPYAGPLFVLIDPLSASTSEIFAAGLQELGRATVVGQRSAGAALPSIVRRLPNGDVLQMAVADFVTPRGNRIEGRGVAPDIEVLLCADRLSLESDPTLAAALRVAVTRLSDND